MPKQLYFIALLPPEEIREDVRQLKLEMKNRFDASHALKAPAHITLQMPFRREEDFENSIIHTLQKFAINQSKCIVNVNGFDSFPPRVLFIKIENHGPIQNIHSKLNGILTHSLNFTENEIKQELHPHMTIATRDLHKAAYHDAWDEFEDREFRTAFEVNSLFLLKHNGKHWDIFREIPFKEKDQS